MNKDKGSKNHKKPPADKSSGKEKPVSNYKLEGTKKDPALAAFIPKPDQKYVGKDKKK
ncbi:MAG TPA: hypothetical protein VK168_13685 [Saprospiraceae bacterium]|nr:hypothetical protein [Saprospiraceae bacterium]